MEILPYPVADMVRINRLLNARIQKAGPDECWPFVGGKTKNGYGRVGGMLAHRAALAIHTRMLPPPEIMALHSCDNPPCCNPAHLSWGTHARNMADRNAKGRNAHGSRSNFARLSEEHAASIKLALTYGVRQTVLAEHFGVSSGLVSSIKAGTRWARVPVAETPDLGVSAQRSRSARGTLRELN